jgi:hypothetical protein
LKKRVLFFLFILLLSVQSIAENIIKVNYNKKPLNTILIELREKYEIKLSYNPRLLSHYSITSQGEFANCDKLIEALLIDLPLSFEKLNNVYVIYKNSKVFIIRGQIIDAATNNPISNSHIKINGQQLISSDNGMFSAKSKESNIFKLHVSHLGYYIRDSILQGNKFHKVYLKTLQTELPEVQVSDNLFQSHLNLGQNAGAIRMNTRVAKYLPTSDDNTIFGLLQMQPGVMGTGDLANNLIIWGAYIGESKLKLDGMNIRGMKNFYDDIGVINPFMVSSIDLYKGGYSAKYDGSIGGLVLAKGKKASKLNPKFNFRLNNITSSISYQTPLNDNSAIIVSCRKTYYNLYKDNQIRFANSSVDNSNIENSKTEFIDLSLNPAYSFTDFNLKYDWRISKYESLEITALYGKDDYNYKITPDKGEIKLRKKNDSNTQNGVSINYTKFSKKGNYLKMNLASSQLLTRMFSNTKVEYDNKIHDYSKSYSYNDIRENSFAIDHKYMVSKKQNIEIGARINFTNYVLNYDSLNISKLKIRENYLRPMFYIQNNVSISEKIDITAGLNLCYPTHMTSLHINPRFNLNYSVTDRLKIKFAWGKYRQFDIQTSFISSSPKYEPYWIMADKNIPSLVSNHYVGTFSYDNNFFTFNMNLYRKDSDGHSRIKYFNNEIVVAQGKSNTKGFDAYVKSTYRKITAWLSYSYSVTNECFDYFVPKEYIRAPQDQRHELKTAMVGNFNPFYFSASFVYGTGLPVYNDERQMIAEPSYNRTDLSMIYKLPIKKYKSEIGLKFQNVFGVENITSGEYEIMPWYKLSSVSLYTETVPSSVRFYFNLEF